MEKKFRINLPPSNITPEEVQSKIRAELNDKSQDYILAKIFVFIYNNQPLTVTNVKELLDSYYKRNFDRATMSRYFKRLVNLGLLETMEGGWSLISESQGNGMRLKVRERYLSFLNKIPEQFKDKFKHTRYFFVSSFGETFVPWVCKVLDLKFEEEKNE